LSMKLLALFPARVRFAIGKRMARNETGHKDNQ
ncbi:short-chain dehydrogenase, partial [Pseudomonas tremae]|nr:short-chain dehydrogenase [Pseudomonas tremae]